MKHIRILSLSITVLVLDIITKILFYNKQFLADSFLFSPHFNTGVAWSLPVPSIIIWIVTLAAFAMIVYRYHTKQLIWWIAALLLWWIVGNAYDRLFLWWVRDFITIGSFPVFNIADIAITVWVWFLMLHLLYPWKYRAKN